MRAIPEHLCSEVPSLRGAVSSVWPLPCRVLCIPVDTWLKSFWRRVSPGNQLPWYWKPNKQNTTWTYKRKRPKAFGEACTKWPCARCMQRTLHASPPISAAWHTDWQTLLTSATADSTSCIQCSSKVLTPAWTDTAAYCDQIKSSES